MLVPIYIYEYIFLLHPLWLDLKIEKNYHSEEGGGGGEEVVGYYDIHEENFCWLWEKKRAQKCQHILSQTSSVTAL